MPSRQTAAPKYRHYKPKDLAVVRIDGKDHYLGKHGSPESWERYHRLLADRSAGLPSVPKASDVPGLTVTELVLAYWRHVRSYYRRPDGSPSAEQDNIKLALRPLRKLYGSSPAADFGPISLTVVRRSMIDSGLARTTINQRVGRIARAFKWGVENELLPPSSRHALEAVSGLKKGRTTAPEPKPVRPVAVADVDAVLPFLSGQVRAMVELQRLTAMRTGEVATMRTGDIDRSGEVWTYTPRAHKTGHLGHTRRIAIGPRAREILLPWLRVDPDAYLFQPREAVAARNERSRRNRKSPMTPSQAARKPKQNPKRQAWERYDKRS